MNLNDIELKVDSAEKLAAVNGKPTENYLFATEFNAIVEKVKEHDLSVNKDSILVVGDDAKAGNVYTYNNYVWRINGTTYNNNSNPINITINSVTAGYKRKDITYFDTNNNIVKLQGVETNGEIVESPALPPNAILFRTYDVDDSGVIVGDPIFGDDYVKKIYSGVYAFSGSGVDAVIPFNPEGKTEVRLTNPALISIAGFTNENLSGTDQRPFQGQIFTIRNLTGNSVLLKHESLEALLSCYLNESTNLVIPNKGVITLIFDNAGMFEKFKSWSINSSIPFQHKFLSPNFSPASSTTYYFAAGNLGTLASASTSNVNRRLGCVKTGKVTKVHLEFSVGLSATDPNNLTVYLDNITQVSSLLITNSLIVTGNQGFINLDVLSDFFVDKDDELTLRTVTPVWGSNPTNFNLMCDILIE